MRVSEMCMPIKLSRISADEALVGTGVRFYLFFLKSAMISFVLLTLRHRLLSWHRMVTSTTSLLLPSLPLV